MTVVDTSVLIDHLRGYTPATVLLDDLLAAGMRLVTSELVRYELLAGVRAGDQPALETQFEILDFVPVTEAISREGGALARRFRHSHSGIDAVDYLLAATASVLDAPLVTRNLRHFPMLEDLEPPY